MPGSTVRKKLLISDGRRERELVLVDHLIVGRDPTCDLSHDDSLLSRRHAQFDADGDRVTVRDLGSRNGVFVNGLRAAEQLLRPGDVVQIGPLKVRYSQDEKPLGILPSVDLDSSERTRITKPSEPVADRRGDTSAIAHVESLDGDSTKFVPPPPPDRGAPGGATRAAPPPLSEVRTFVFVQMFTLAGVVMLAASVPIVMASAPLVWLALPFVVAIIAAYFVGSLIIRRFVNTLRVAKKSPGLPRA